MSALPADVFVLPMSPAQQRLWFLDQMDPGSTLFNIPIALRLAGPLSVDALGAALSAVIARHEVLRTTLQAVDNEPMQIIHPARPLALAVDDLSGLAPAARESALLREVRSEAAQAFDLATGPLIRVRCWRLADQDHAVMLSLHHAIADGWSMGVLYREIGHYYRAALVGRDDPLPELPIQYADYAHWHRERMLSGELDRQRAYWLKQLGGYSGFLNLPTDHPRPATQTFDAADYEFRFPERVSDALKAFCQDMGVTLFMGTLTAYALLLSRYSGQNDLCIGIPVAGRSEAELQDLIGFFVNGMVLRFRFSPQASLRQTLLEARQTVLDGFANQDLSVDSLFDGLQLRRDPAYEPLVQCTFALQNFPRRPETTPGLDIRPLPVECMHSRYDLMLLLMELPETLAGNMVYNSRLFDEASMARMMDHLIRLIEAMCQAPDAPLATLDFVGPEERYALLGLDPAQVARILPLNSMQRDLYMDSQAHPDSPQNTIGGAFEIRAEVDIAAWQGLIQTLSDQQPVLRTRLVNSPLPWTEPVYQVVLRQDTPLFSVLDWQDRELSTPSALVDALSALIRQPFPVEGPLLRHHLIRLGPAHWMAVLINHHLLLDGIGTANALQWLADAYSGRSPLDLPPDASHLQLPASRQASDSAPLLAWWQPRLAGVEPPLCPGAQPTTDQPERCQRTLPIPADLWEGLRHASRQARVTPQIFLKAAYSLLAAAHTQCPGDLLIQEFIAGRGTGQASALGCYYQAQPFVVPQAFLAGQGDFAALLAHTRDWQKEAGQHSGLSILEQRRLAPLGRTTFMFNYITAQLAVQVGDTRSEILRFTPYAEGFVQFEISMTGDSVLMGLNYDPSRFAEDRFLERLQHLCRQLLADPARPLAQLDFSLPDENPTVAEAPLADYQPLSERIAAQAALTPDAPAVFQGERSLSYGALMAAADLWTDQLLAAGAGPGERVGICLPRSPEMVIALVAVLQSGAAYVPMDAAYPAERLSRIAGDADCRVILTQGCLESRLAASSAHRLLMDAPPPPCPPQPHPQRRGSDPFYVLYTSGSTGLPKGAVVRDDAAANLVDWYAREFAVTAADRFFVMSAFGFDLTQKNFFAALTRGAALVLPTCQDFDPEALSRDLARHRATLINGAPSAFAGLVDDPALYPRLASLRYVFLGGEPIPLGRLAPWLGHADCHATLVNTYGPTECTDVVAAHVITDPLSDPAQRIPLGRAVDHAGLHICDEAGRRPPPFGVGELRISGLCVGDGYWRDPALTAARFQPLPGSTPPRIAYRSGDLVYARADGLPVYVGRKDFQVKVRGLRIELGEIEAALRDSPGGEWLVLADRDRLIAYVRAERAPALAEVRQAVAHRLPESMLPNAVVAVAAWPLGAHGKVDRRALAALEAASPEREFQAPATPAESRLARLWQEALGHGDIDRRDNFFSIGGHSLLAARLVSRIRQEFAVDLPLRALFDHPTLSALAAFLVPEAPLLADSAEEAELADLLAATADLSPEELEALLSDLDAPSAE